MAATTGASFLSFKPHNHPIEGVGCSSSLRTTAIRQYFNSDAVAAFDPRLGPVISETLRRYDNGRRVLQSRLEALDDPKETISRFFDTIVRTTVEDPEKKGCFLFNTTLEMDIHDTEITTLLADAVSEIESFLRRTIEAGQMRNQFPAHIDAAARAKALVASTAAIRVLGRGVYSRSDLQSVADEAKRSLE